MDLKLCGRVCSVPQNLRVAGKYRETLAYKKAFIHLHVDGFLRTWQQRLLS